MKWLVLTLLLVATSAAAQTQPAPPVSDPRIQTLAYDPGQVFRLRVASGYQLSVIFSPDERVENVALGDSEAWQVTLNGRADAMFIRPLRARNPTNMTVITDVRIYNFELSPAFGPGADAPFTVQFRYPPTSAQPTAALTHETGRYRLSGNRAIRPAAMADDGVRTSIEWRQGQTLPAVFALDDQGHEVLVDGSMRDGLFVIDGIHRTLVFRLDGQTARGVRFVPRRRR